MQIFETWQHEQVVPSLTKQNALFIKATTSNMLANGTPTAFQFDTFPRHYRMPLARVESWM
jgi:hypothetical protein